MDFFLDGELYWLDQPYKNDQPSIQVTGQQITRPWERKFFFSRIEKSCKNFCFRWIFYCYNLFKV